MPKPRKPGVQYEKVWRVRWPSGDMDFGHVAGAMYWARLFHRLTGKGASVEEFKRAKV